MKITKQWLQENSVCSSGVDWFTAQKETEGVKVVEKLAEEDKLPWANWLIVRIMNYKQRVTYAVFAAEQVIEIFARKYPSDKRPQQAIEAAKKCIENPTAAQAAEAIYAASEAVHVPIRLKILQYGLTLTEC